MSTFFELFRYLVDQRGESHTQIAARALVSPSTVNRIYNEYDLPSRLTLQRIALQGLGLDREQYARLEALRRDEEPRNHATHGRGPVEVAQAGKD